MPGRNSKTAVGERKTRRLNLVLKPTVVEDAQKIAYMENLSLNELISALLTDYSAKRSDMIEKYDALFGSAK